VCGAKELGLFANLRPAQVYPSSPPPRPLKAELVAGLDILTYASSPANIYFRRAARIRATATAAGGLHTIALQRGWVGVSTVAFEAARKRSRPRLLGWTSQSCSETSQLWRSSQ